MHSDEPWDRYERLVVRGRENLSVSERGFVALGDLRIQVPNGGFSQYFGNGFGEHAELAVAAAEAAGIPALADLVRAALRRLGTTGPAGHEAHLERLDRVGYDAFDDLDDAFYTLESTTDLDAAVLSLLATSDGA